MTGEGGIRTPGTAKRLNGFQDRLLRPLGHLSREQKTRPPQKALEHERLRISFALLASFTIPIDRIFVNKTALFAIFRANPVMDRTKDTQNGDAACGSV